MKHFKSLFLVIIFLFYPISFSYGDIVHLKNGNKIEGEIVEDTQEYVKVRVKIGDLRINKIDIELIEKKELPEGFFDREPIIAEEPKTETDDVKEEKEQKKQLKDKITVSAIFLKEEGVVDVKGETVFPDGSLIYVFFKRFNSYIASKEVPVGNGVFSVRFGPFEKDLPYGKYRIDADFMPDRQPKEIVELLNEKDKRLTEAVYILDIGTDEEIKGERKMVVEGITNTIKELEVLYKELDNKFNENQKSPDPSGWEAWANDWSFRLKELEKRNEERISEYEVPLFPEAEESLAQAIRILSCILEVDTMFVKEPVKVGEIFNSPDARVTPAELRKSFSAILERGKNF